MKQATLEHFRFTRDQTKGAKEDSQGEESEPLKKRILIRDLAIVKDQEEAVTPKITRSGRVFDKRRYSIRSGRYSISAFAIPGRRARNKALPKCVKASEDANFPSTSATLPNVEEIALEKTNLLASEPCAKLRFISCTELDESSPLILEISSDSSVAIVESQELTLTQSLTNVKAQNDLPTTFQEIFEGHAEENFDDSSTDENYGNFDEYSEANESQQNNQLHIEKDESLDVQDESCIMKMGMPRNELNPEEAETTLAEATINSPETTYQFDDTIAEQDLPTTSKEMTKRRGRQKGNKKIPEVKELHPSLLLPPPKVPCLKESKSQFIESNNTQIETNRPLSQRTVHWPDDKENASLCNVRFYELPRHIRIGTLKKTMYANMD